MGKSCIFRVKVVGKSCIFVVIRYNEFMLKRKITQILEKWRSEEQKPCLLVKGARQVGKTFVVDQFARDNYQNYIYVNFELQPEYKKIFDGNLDFETLKLNLEVNFPNVKIEKGKTLLFLDEIQSCPNARVALKSFATDGTLDVIASGSLLGLYYKEVSSYPVGYERSVELFPLDFEEFLWALGVSEDVITELRNGFAERRQVSESVISKVAEYFRLYLIVGGMPQAVNTYLQSNSVSDVRVVQRSLIESYKNDVMKYASVPDKQKILKTFESIPVQLAKKNKKFVYSEIDIADKSPSERKYSSAIYWLKDAGIVNFCYNLHEPALPLDANRNLDSFKMYMRDTGLLVSMMDLGVPKAIVENDLYINEGGLLENVCAEEVMTRYESLTYFERRGKLEIDFVINIDGQATAIEVKSGNNKLAKSLTSIIENYKTVTRYVMLENGNKIYVDDKGVEHYPLFMVMFL